MLLVRKLGSINSKIMKSFFSALILLCCAFQLSAQNTIGLNVQGFVPTGELRKDSPGIWGGGFALTGAFNIRQSPIYAGGTLDFTRYGSEVRDGWHGQVLGDVRHRRQFEMTRLLGFIRLSPDCDAGFYPYVDFTAGVNYVYTRSILRDGPLRDAFDHFTDWDDFSFTYGLSAGIEVPLGEDVLLDLYFKSLKSGRTEYLSPSSVNYDRENNEYLLEVQQSKFDSFTFGIGIKAYLY